MVGALLVSCLYRQCQVPKPAELEEPTELAELAELAELGILRVRQTVKQHPKNTQAHFEIQGFWLRNLH